MEEIIGTKENATGCCDESAQAVGQFCFKDVGFVNVWAWNEE